MNTHDVLAYSVATELVRRVRAGRLPGDSIFSAGAYLTASRTWPVPDFVLVDTDRQVTAAAEFKPPKQTKREYLTGLGQALAYGRDFNYGLLVLPTIADDGYPIAEHVRSVLMQPPYASLPVGLLSYNPATLSPTNASFDEAHFFAARASAPARPARLDTSFYAKWREQGPTEIHLSLKFAYEEMHDGAVTGRNVRDRAFDKLWDTIQGAGVPNWSGVRRRYADTEKNKRGIAKNYRNFTFHIGWTEADGALTRAGLEAMHVGTLYGATSRPFIDEIARALLLAGKHLVLLNEITIYQDRLRPVPDVEAWLDGLEAYLDQKGLLKRNEERGLAATRGEERGFLKAEKQLWRELGLTVPYGPAKKLSFHPGRGMIFDWARITSLVQQT